MNRLALIVSLLSAATVFADAPTPTQTPTQTTDTEPPTQTTDTEPTPSRVPARARDTTDQSTRVTRALARLESQEPSLGSVRAAALRTAALDGSAERAWGRRARLSGLLPDLTLRATRATGSDRDVSRSSSGTERLDVGTDHDFDIEARAVWELDRLVFDDIEIRALQAAQRSARERALLLGQVTSLYYQRRKLVLQGLLTPPGDVHKAALHALNVAELTGQLDALTGGQFSRALKRRTASVQ